VCSAKERTVAYRCVAQDLETFIQQVAVSYVTHGYWFYVTGRIPKGKDPSVVDEKPIQKYGLDISRVSLCALFEGVPITLIEGRAQRATPCLVRRGDAAARA